MPEPSTLRDYWLAETLRLRETLWGPLDDEAEARRARTRGGDFAARILERARLLAVREKLDTTIARWASMSRAALLIMAVAALFAGAGAASGALGDGSRPVNIMLALAALLGLNTLTLLFWLASFAWPAGATGGSWLGEAWLWLTRRLARGPDAALAPRALLELLSRHNAVRWVLGAVSHGLWSLGLGSALAVMLAVLSTRRYQFNWETTLLSPDAFVSTVTTLGWLPSRLGFSMPSAELIRASDGLQALPAEAQAQWSGWLIGCLVIYALLPRVLALAISLVISATRLRHPRLDTSLPGFAELRDRLWPASERAGIDAPDGKDVTPAIGTATPAALRPGQPLLAGIELPADVRWPPPGLAAGVANVGVIDSGTQRKAVLDRLTHATPARMLLVCDARQTPDRGTLALVAELAQLASQTRLALPVPPGESSREALWRERLQAAGFADTDIESGLGESLVWLAGGASQAPAPASAPTEGGP
ncbi:DUF2868 domain-containing protein [Pusillimonas sp. TS35]|uniref:DUF2868 domain-containing protein n=1 Tax=Paracandidimonas lactea TaxID=2895524 RepID=UPI00137029DE|nr:DUF2868 domain-containing protein [Paracandidimonas lactea]MYN12450.1 DUF2868 domain-containing protein [Pusillimonas sp. TS35]